MSLNIHEIVHAILIFEGDICHGAPCEVRLIAACRLAKCLLKMPTEKRLHSIADCARAFSCVFREKLRRTLEQSRSALLNQLMSI